MRRRSVSCAVHVSFATLSNGAWYTAAAIPFGVGITMGFFWGGGWGWGCGWGHTFADCNTKVGAMPCWLNAVASLLVLQLMVIRGGYSFFHSFVSSVFVPLPSTHAWEQHSCSHAPPTGTINKFAATHHWHRVICYWSFPIFHLPLPEGWVQ